jgi:PAS domain S-box-containing protein
MKKIPEHPALRYWEKWREEIVKSREMTFALQFMEVMPDGAVITDTEDRILETNKVILKTSGYRKEELIGKPVSDLIKIGKKFGTMLRVQRLITGETLKKTRSVILTKRGEKIPITLNARLIVNEEGEPRFTLWVFKDITELVRAEEEQREKLLHTLTLLQKTWEREKQKAKLPPSIWRAQINAIEEVKKHFAERPSPIIQAYKELLPSKGKIAPDEIDRLLKKRKKVIKSHKRNRRTKSKASIALPSG